MSREERQHLLKEVLGFLASPTERRQFSEWSPGFLSGLGTFRDELEPSEAWLLSVIAKEIRSENDS